MTADRPHRGGDVEPGWLQLIEEVTDLSVGLGVMLLPLLILAVPAIILIVVPAVLLLAVAAVPVAAGAAVAMPAYLLARSVRRRRRARRAG